MEDLFNSDITLDEVNKESVQAATEPTQFRVGVDSDVAEELDEELKRTDRKDVDYSVDSDCSVLFSTESLAKIINQLSTVVDLNSPRIVSRGLSFIVTGDGLDIITPNELYYFKAHLDTEICTFSEGVTFFIDYSFLNKMLRFLPLKVLIYKKNDIYYLRLITGDLELINTDLLESDRNKLKQDYEVLPDIVTNINRLEVIESLGTLSKLYSFSQELPKRTFDIKDGVVQFITPVVKATSTLHLPDVRLVPPVVSYLLKACSLCTLAGNVELHQTTSENLTRYAIVYDGITMLTNYAGSKFDDDIKARADLLPAGTVIQFNELKYVLEYVNSITYASGHVTLKVKGDKIIGKIKLNNNNESEIEIPVVSNEITLPRDLSAVVNAKYLYKAFNTLDTKSTTYIGYANGLIYLWNSKVILTVMTLGG